MSDKPTLEVRKILEAALRQDPIRATAIKIDAEGKLMAVWVRIVLKIDEEVEVKS